jgi:cyclic pyranopterin phosphate synthase
MLTAIDGIRDVAITTNGLLLAEQAQELKDAGLGRLNISLDTLRPDAFKQIARRDGLEQVLEGIDAARNAGFEKIRLNAVAIRGLSEPDIVPLVQFARQRGMEMRFIEFMPLDGDEKWKSEQVLSGREILRMIEAHVGRLRPVERDDPSQPASDFEFIDGSGRIGLINPVTQPFCGRCNRLRLTAEGKVRNCLFSTVEWNALAVLRGGGEHIDRRLADLVRQCVGEKKAGHGIDSPEFVRPERAMYQIGG